MLTTLEFWVGVAAGTIVYTIINLIFSAWSLVYIMNNLPKVMPKGAFL